MNARVSSFAAIACLAMLLAPVCDAKDSYMLFGGGPNPKSSQVSIEQNVVWIDRELLQLNFADRHVLYGSGPGGTPDVVLNANDDPLVQHWLPLARIFGKQKDAGVTYRHDDVTRSEGNAGADNVTRLLRSQIETLQTGDNLLLIYSGHGSYQPDDVSRNALRLWGDSHLDVNAFSHLLNRTPNGATVRYVLPQCYSGAFARSITPDPRHPDLSQVKVNRCGFFAVSDNKEAEGCTPSVDIGDYRDYSTYFMAALVGHTRTGQALTANPDTNGDGRVSLSEAHAYAYTEGFSTDVPRSTSDYYLQLWAPWYVRWHSFVPLAADNPYWQMAQKLARHRHLNATTPHRLAVQALDQRRRLADEIDAAEAALQRKNTEAEKLQKQIRNRFLVAWPQASEPYSASYRQFLADAGEQALQWIIGQPDYPGLVAVQNGATTLELHILELRREDAQYERILRALRLAALRENFQRLASPDQQRTYTALVRCENWVMPSP